MKVEKKFLYIYVLRLNNENIKNKKLLTRCVFKFIQNSPLLDSVLSMIYLFIDSERVSLRYRLSNTAEMPTKISTISESVTNCRTITDV